MDLKIPRFDELKERLDKERLDIKDRLGFKEAPRTRPSSRRDDSYDDFGEEDFGEYAFDDNADYARHDAASTGSFSPQMPKLVTADDVRAHTQYTPSEEPVEAPSADRASAALSAAKAGVEASSAAQTASFGVVRDSVPPVEPAAAPVVAAAEPRVVRRATRILTVIKPESYADAERISKILKSGDVAVLSLRNTPEELANRILDFGFGVACALDARVECVSGRVFAMTRGAGLTEGELGRLRDQGLM